MTMKKHISNLDIAKPPKPIESRIRNRASRIEGGSSCLNISQRMGAIGRTLVKKIMVHKDDMEHCFEMPSDRSSLDLLTPGDQLECPNRC